MICTARTHLYSTARLPRQLGTDARTVRVATTRTAQSNKNNRRYACAVYEYMYCTEHNAGAGGGGARWRGSRSHGTVYQATVLVPVLQYGTVVQYLSLQTKVPVCFGIRISTLTCNEITNEGTGTVVATTVQ